ncbi:hypothetical protein VD0003_g7040 [Verticillium dahliae]|nr:hypothetical protein VD0003_g7040 [Verticillium dahliae]
MAADEPDWRPTVSASDRFENIQNIKSALEGANPGVAVTAQSEAFALENQAFRDSASRDRNNMKTPAVWSEMSHPR